MNLTSQDVLDRLLRDRSALIRRQAEADRVIAASGAGHLVHEMNVRPNEAGGRPWRIDPVPVVLDGATFDRLAAGVVERFGALERVLADLYGPRQLVRDGIVPGEALSSSVRYRVGVVGTPAPSRWLTTYAADVVALADGTWRIVQDLTDAPTGVGYALLDRSAMLRVADEILGAEGVGAVASLTGVAAELRHALAANTPVPSPRIVLYSGGVNHPGYVEHSSLARLLGYTLVERPDLVVRQGRVWLRVLGGLDPVDVVYRRVEDDDTDAIEISGAGGRGVPGLLMAVANGGLVLANAHGSGLIEDPALAAHWPAAAYALTGASLQLPQIGDAARTVRLAEMPAFRGGQIGSTAVVVRLHAIAGSDGITVVPGGNGRVLAAGDDPRHPSAHLAKDVWVIGSSRTLVPMVAPLPQVDLAQSVPTRAAAALFWACRGAERAESIARTIRVVSARRRQDPTLVAVAGARWARQMAAALRAVRGARNGGGDDSHPTRSAMFDLDLDVELEAAGRELVERLRMFIGEAATVGEFLPSNTARILHTLAKLTDEFAGASTSSSAPIDALDDVLASLSAFAGMWSESTVRGPAWRFGDIGIRVERALVVLGLIAACVDPRTARSPVLDVVDVASLEVLLAANESLVAYRRQYRSDVDVSATFELLLRDRDNPRAYLSCMDRVAEHVVDVEWAEGSAKVALLAEMVSSMTVDDLAGGDPIVDRIAVTHDAVGAFTDQIVDRWFATPVKPMLVQAAP